MITFRTPLRFRSFIAPALGLAVAATAMSLAPQANAQEAARVESETRPNFGVLLDRPAPRRSRAQPSTPGSVVRCPGADRLLADGDEPEEHGTSHFAVVDGSGGMISYTSTIESAFGSGLMVDGFYLNNELTDFSRSPMVNGKPVANRVEGGKRPRSSMSPVVVYDPQGKPFMAVGAAGGSTIPVQTARSIIGVIDFGLDAEQALGLPFVMAFGDAVLLEQGTWLAESQDGFRALGHQTLSVRPAPVKAGALLRRDGRWVSARDPRLADLLDLP